ncbi:hypothetical protein LTR85_005155 [Meristemomyces frigidus]|nr:hypothetical protein LTR85_005155 [Meristemomyces frigidus]
MADNDDRPSSAIGLKRRRSELTEQESKRQRTSPGKESPAVKTEELRDEKHDTPTDAKPAPKAEDPRDTRRKSGVADEKQRSKRLFGALLGPLNNSGDRTSKRRQEIEARRKAELQRQDDERLEDKQRRLEQLAQQRKDVQKKVDEQNMRMRHKDMLDTANFLQTTTESKLYYRPWDLRPDEEDRIEDQIKEAQDQIDKELGISQQGEDDAVRADKANGADASATEAIACDSTKVDQKDDVDAAGNSAIVSGRDAQEEAPAKSTEDIDTDKPAEVPDSDATNRETNDEAPSKADGAEEERSDKPQGTEDDGGHVVEGEEDTLIY